MNPRLAAAVVVSTALLALAPTQAGATPVPQPQSATAENRAAAARAAAAPDTLATLSRFFAREGKVSLTAAQPRIEGEAMAVHHLSPEFVAGRPGAGVARLEFLASRAVSSDGQQAALWTAKTEAGWQVVNIATGDDEFRYAGLGAAKLPGGTVFREPQIDAWYVAGGERVLPLDEDAVAAVGAGGTSLAAYRARVVKAYGDKLPGSAYAKSGKAGGFAPTEAAAGSGGTRGPLPAGAGAGAVALAMALGAGGLLAVRRSRRQRVVRA
ncbi:MULTISPECIES: hypothetical protein [unclassified Streptomyces]|uniref:hypothetical protein n=1 Tax=unclassified Streptomyces TaxID=2593676 RepID=UPI000DC7B15D|nr:MULTISPECIES: hypothetical protein [unclassified Streptomyces]AWZ07926.1 hypothetical protein DRB89_28670 [Streptomyces sp. ICC4]AWZ15742.1 hypothetical protein DRB96_29720 [Streptomyces sp. ICC1]